MAIKEIKDLLYKFLWDGKGDKIKRMVVIYDYQEGGIKMLDIKSFNSALKATWIPKYLDVNNKGKWKIDIGYQEYKKKIFLPTTFLEKMLKRSTLMKNFCKSLLKFERK